MYLSLKCSYASAAPQSELFLLHLFFSALLLIEPLQTYLGPPNAVQMGHRHLK